MCLLRVQQHTRRQAPRRTCITCIHLCIHTSSQAVRCASAVLDVVRGFSLDGFAQGALSECTITLHAGMGVGELSVLYVGGDNQRHEQHAEHAAQPSVRQVPQGLGLGRD